MRPITIAILSLGLAAVLPAADNSLGTWKRNISKTKTLTPAANPVKSYSMVREAAGNGVKTTVNGERADGSKIQSSYTLKYDGVPVPVTGDSPFDKYAMKQIDANTFTTEAWNSRNKYHTKGKTVVSKDGKTLTATFEGTDVDGKPLKTTVVSERQ